MVTISDALPIQFWPIGQPTFNEAKNGFVDYRPFYQFFYGSDVIKLQVLDTDSNTYALKVLDCDGNIVTTLNFVNIWQWYDGQDVQWPSGAEVDLGGSPANSWDIEFRVMDAPLSLTQDTYLQFVIQQNGSDFYKSDLIQFNFTASDGQSFGAPLISYRSNYNFAGINYPNDGGYFNLRILGRFFEERNRSQQTSIALSGSKTITTSTFRQRQKFLETFYMPDYMLNKLELALDHNVRGSLSINDVEWVVDESFDRTTVDTRFAFRKAKIWLTRKDYSSRNII